MRKMKDSGIEWIGEIPEGWETRKIKYLLSVHSDSMRIGPFGSNLSGSVIQREGNYKVYGQENLIADDFTIGDKYISDEKYKALKAYTLIPDDVTISMMGTIGKCSIVPNSVELGIMDSHLIRLRIDSDTIIVSFFKYSFESVSSIAQLFFYSKGSIMNGLNSAIIRSVNIAVPYVAEQRDICNYLDRKCAEIDSLIKAKETTNEKLKEYRQSVIYEVVTKGLDKNAKMKDSGVEWIGEVPEEWETKKLKYIGESIIGITYSPDDVSEDGVLVLRSSNIQNGKISFGDNVYVSKTINKEMLVNQGDILICSRNGSSELIGKSALIDEKAEGSTFGAFMTLFRSRSNRYIYYVLNSPIFSFYIGTFLTTTVNQLTINNLNNIIIPFPKNEKEQQQIADYLDHKCAEIDSVIAANENTINKLKEYRQSVIYEAVTGKVEI